MYELSSFFFYKALFMVELIVAELLFAFNLPKKRYFYLRLTASIIFAIGFAFALPVFFYNALYSSLLFIIMFCLSVLLLKFNFDVSFSSILFCGLAGYTTQHLAYALNDILLNLAGISGEFQAYGESNLILDMAPYQLAFLAIFYLISYEVVYWLVYLFFARQIKKHQSLKVKNTSLLFLSFLLLGVNIFLGALLTYYSYENLQVVYIVFYDIISFIFCLLLLFIQFELLFKKDLEEETETLKKIWHQEKEQFEKAKENIDLINIKCHDLKHQLSALGERKFFDKETLSEMTNLIKIYDSNVKTGNETLDVVLTEKSLFCENENIHFSYIVDGESLNFMSNSDIYSLFGNALDNSIEASLKLEDTGRIVTLNVRKIKNFVSISVQNNFVGDLSFDDNLPITTKNDKLYHGYGLKSIKHICNKYNGNMTISHEDNVFILNLLFPI